MNTITNSNGEEIEMITDEMPFTVEWVLLTPELAKIFLEKNYKGNRSINTGNLEKFKVDMLAGLWKVSHQGIAFSENDDMIDGQHTATAVLETGVSIWTPVFFGVPEASFKAIDGGAARTLTSFMEGKHKATRSALIRYAYALDANKGIANSSRIANASKHKSSEFYENYVENVNPDLMLLIPEIAAFAEISYSDFGTTKMGIASMLYATYRNAEWRFQEGEKYMNDLMRTLENHIQRGSGLPPSIHVWKQHNIGAGQKNRTTAYTYMKSTLAAIRFVDNDTNSGHLKEGAFFPGIDAETGKRKGQKEITVYK